MKNIEQTKTIKSCVKDQYVYMVIPRDALEAGRTLFKIGVTYNIIPILKRFSKNSVLMYLNKVEDMYYVEDRIKYLFNKCFKLQIWKGCDYYSGSGLLMEKLLNLLVNKMEQKIESDFVNIRNKCDNLNFYICNHDEIDSTVHSAIYDKIDVEYDILPQLLINYDDDDDEYFLFLTFLCCFDLFLLILL